MGTGAKNRIDYFMARAHCVWQMNSEARNPRGNSFQDDHYVIDLIKVNNIGD